MLSPGSVKESEYSNEGKAKNEESGGGGGEKTVFHWRVEPFNYAHFLLYRFFFSHLVFVGAFQNIHLVVSLPLFSVLQLFFER